jgi:predicted XRE-type DNA-binding protein
MSTKQEKKYAEEAVVTGSGNVFADLGLPNPEQRLAKAHLVQRIAEVIKERELTQKQAGLFEEDSLSFQLQHS